MSDIKDFDVVGWMEDNFAKHAFGKDRQSCGLGHAVSFFKQHHIDLILDYIDGEITFEEAQTILEWCPHQTFGKIRGSWFQALMYNYLIWVESFFSGDAKEAIGPDEQSLKAALVTFLSLHKIAVGVRMSEVEDD